MGSLSDDESADSEEDDDQSTEDETGTTSTDTSDVIVVDDGNDVSIDDFLLSPTSDSFMKLGENRSSIILTEAKVIL